MQLDSLQRDTVNVWGIPFARVTLAESIEWVGAIIERRRPEYLITANLNYCMLADQDPTLEAVTKGAIGILADGMPIVVRSRSGSDTPLPERVAGSELIYRLAERAAAEGWRIFFLGAAPGVAQKCASRLETLYPGLQVAGVLSPPFRNLSEQEDQQLEHTIRASRADILLVAFGQPKGEKWIADRYQRLGIPVSIQLGASFDFVAGTARRAPKIWQRCGMEWAYRMLGDPRRLVPRYSLNLAYLFQAILRDARHAFSMLTTANTRLPMKHTNR